MAYDLLNMDGEVFRYDVETQAGQLVCPCTSIILAAFITASLPRVPVACKRRCLLLL